MEVSHKVLVVLITVAIVFLVMGTLFNIEKISRLTGYGSTGYVNVTIDTSSVINVTATDCAFGNGYIVTGNVSALLESNGSKYGWSGAGTAASIQLRNDGNTNLSVNVSSGKTLASFYGVDCSSQTCTYQFWSADKEGGSCTTGLVAYPGVSMDTGNKTLCTLMRHQDTMDEVYVHCRLNITQSVTPGAKTDTWTFWVTGL